MKKLFPKTIVGVTLCMVVGALGACAADRDAQANSSAVASPTGDAPSSQSNSGLDTSPIIDPDTGTILLAADRYAFLSPYDNMLFTEAVDGVATECAKAQGVKVDLLVRGLPDPVYAITQQFGVWTDDQASRFGFSPPQTAADMVVNGVTNGSSAGSDPQPAAPRGVPFGDLSESEKAVVQECRRSKEARRFELGILYKGGPWLMQLYDATNAALAGPEAGTVLEEYNSCLAAKGLAPSLDNPYSVQGADAHQITAEQIQLALTSVACKDAVELVPRLARIVSSAQEPIIDEYAAELGEQGQRMDSAREEARTYLASYTHAP